MPNNNSSFLDILPDFIVSCGPVSLVVPTLEQTVHLARQVSRGLFASGEQITLGGWYDPDRPVEMARGVISHQMNAWQPGLISKINLPFAIIVNQDPVGIQGLVETSAGPFRLSKELATGSWLAPQFRGKGFGVPARVCALYIAFKVMGAQTVVSQALRMNTPSRRVSERCGYTEDGVNVVTSRGTREEKVRFRITEEKWKTAEHPDVHAHKGDALRIHILGN